MYEIILRNLTEDDFQRIEQFELESHILGDEDLNFEEQFREILKKKRAWIAELEGKPIGCVSLSSKNWIYISILPEYRRKGFGKLILEMVPVRGVTVWAKVPKANIGAIRLCRSAKFNDYEVTKNSIIMRKNY